MTYPIQLLEKKLIQLESLRKRESWKPTMGELMCLINSIQELKEAISILKAENKIETQKADST